MTDCLFCKIIAGALPAEVIGESEHFLCFLDIKPITRGHALVVPKQHCRDLQDFPDGLEAEYLTFLKTMSQAIVSAVGADGYNIGMNNGAAAGQVIFHQHTHIIPRFANDGLTSWPDHDASPDELAALAERIRAEQ